jgi:hypothetical protein
VEAGLIDVGLLDDVRQRADEVARAGQFTQKTAVIDFALVEQLGRIEHVLNIDENTETLRKRARNECWRTACAAIHVFFPFVRFVMEAQLPLAAAVPDKY